jgi:hypothetical protein
MPTDKAQQLHPALPDGNSGPKRSRILKESSFESSEVLWIDFRQIWDQKNACGPE